jgi:CheY-like chemotaxis protein
MPQFVMLLMEDDPMQREIFVELLNGMGFEVVECTTAEGCRTRHRNIRARISRCCRRSESGRGYARPC